MSRFPTEAWRRRLGRTLRRVRGRLPRYTLYLQPQGLQSWATGSRSGAGVVATAFAGFEPWCVANAGADATVCVSGHLLHSLVVDSALALDDATAVRSYARQQFTHYHGPQAQHWPLAAWCDDRSAVVCALHALDLAALQSTAAKHDVRLCSVAPVWSAGLNSLAAFKPSFAAPGARALALLEGSLLTWLVADAGRIVGLQQRYLDAPRVAALADLLDRLVREGPALAESPFVIGWGLDDGAEEALPRCQLLGPLDRQRTAAHWMLDAIGTGA